MEADEELYGSLVRGDLAAFDRLYERYERRLFGFVRAQLGDANEAEDVFHEAFLAVLDARAAGTEVRSFKAWLFQVARNLCLNRIRARDRTKRALESVGHQALVEAPTDAALPSGDDPGLREAIARLPSGLAAVYQLRASGLSYDELAAILEIPVGTVKSRMHEMVKRLRQEMQQ